MSSKIVLPYEPQYSRHRDTEKRRQQTRDWLAQREHELAERHTAASIVPTQRVRDQENRLS
jgi:hypothetical protein